MVTPKVRTNFTPKTRVNFTLSKGVTCKEWQSLPQMEQALWQQFHSNFGVNITLSFLLCVIDNCSIYKSTLCKEQSNSTSSNERDAFWRELKHIVHAYIVIGEVGISLK